MKTTSTEETIDAGRNIAANLNGGDIVLLQGDLGAGKTTLTKGILSYFGVDEHLVVSPTFTLMQEYSIGNQKSEIRNLVHIDTYRMEDENELVEIGIEDHLADPETVVIIEWPEKLHELLREKDVMTISIEHTSESERTINSNKKAAE